MTKAKRGAGGSGAAATDKAAKAQNLINGFDCNNILDPREFVPDTVTGSQLSQTGTTGAMIDKVWG
ncbi:MAG: hypothetical protein GY761_20665 [Hyphomicrobiales bacterium]|nr:hypothetical protein [Hyphomicrobiales bacterium]